MKFRVLILAVSLTASTAIAADFKLDATGDEPLYQSVLPKEVYQESRADSLQDMIITNAAGEQVPYALLPYHALHPQATSTLDTKPLLVYPIKESSLSNPSELSIQLQEIAQNTSVTLNMNATAKEVKTTYLIDAGKEHPALQTLSVDWQSAEGVFLQLEILASDDLKNWSAVGHGVLLKTSADGKELLQNNITLDYPTKARYIQIRPANGETLILKAVNAQYNSVRSLVPEILWQTLQQVQREQVEKTGVINIDFESQARYPASYLRVQLPQNNTITSASILVRNKSDAPWQTLTSASLYRINKAGKTYTNPDIALDASSWRFWRLQFHAANGGIGAESPTLSLGWLPNTVVWNARGQTPFSLAVGTNPTTINSIAIASLIPDYKIEKVLQLPKAKLTLVANSTTGTHAPASKNSWVSAPDYKTWLLWAGLFLGVLLLAGMAYSLIKTESKK